MQQSGQNRIFAPYTDEIWERYDTEGLGKLDRVTIRLIVPQVLAKLGRSSNVCDEEFDACYNSLELEGHIIKEDLHTIIKFLVN